MPSGEHTVATGIEGDQALVANRLDRLVGHNLVLALGDDAASRNPRGMDPNPTFGMGGNRYRRKTWALASSTPRRGLRPAQGLIPFLDTAHSNYAWPERHFGTGEFGKVVPGTRRHLPWTKSVAARIMEARRESLTVWPPGDGLARTVTSSQSAGNLRSEG